ncbi:SDR family oxidoreductase [Enterococcus plantarum]|uniref:SDR family NAD(P)-dependent oxidoreductase n=1 Tax=Enterococcus plantarum TaxID=1077675 RepID=UPI001A8F7732|nr:SDR family NAD(P)-dependent oxidoreductase [Enterococcus plantarum]MBO0468536.1 SDR family oxidoreductase [Enterococcus plantarum]
MNRLKNKVVLITGAGRGIGRACALAAAKEGADIVISDVEKNIEDVPYDLSSSLQLEKTETDCRNFGASVLKIFADVTKIEEISAMIQEVMDRFGRIDVLINNAGIGAPAGKATHEHTEKEWKVLINVNLSGPWRMIKMVAPIMINQNCGSIINIASTAGLLGYKHFVGYVASKHGVIGLTKSAALDYALNNVRVNAICPGPVFDDEDVDGSMTKVVADSLGIQLGEQEEIDLQSVAMGTVVSPNDVADAAVWLGSDESLRVTGSSITVDAGYSIK